MRVLAQVGAQVASVEALWFTEVPDSQGKISVIQRLRIRAMTLLSGGSFQILCLVLMVVLNCIP
jgi:hypothetical protein